MNPIEGMTGRVARCSPCASNGYTNTNVVSMATTTTATQEEGDFLCLFHNREGATPLGDG